MLIGRLYIVVIKIEPEKDRLDFRKQYEGVHHVG